MTTLRTAAQQALDAIESDTVLFSAWTEKMIAARTALRAALAEPVTWYSVDQPLNYMTRCADGTEFINTVVMPAHAVSWAYTAPPQRKPLTEEEMYAVEEEARKSFRQSQRGARGQQITYWDGLTPWLIRAVERAHGIKE